MTWYVDLLGQTDSQDFINNPIQLCKTRSCIFFLCFCITTDLYEKNVMSWPHFCFCYFQLYGAPSRLTLLTAKYTVTSTRTAPLYTSPVHGGSPWWEPQRGDVCTTARGAGKEPHAQVRRPTPFPVKNICTMPVQRRRRWTDVVQMLYTCFVFVGNGTSCLLALMNYSFVSSLLNMAIFLADWIDDNG